MNLQDLRSISNIRDVVDRVFPVPLPPDMTTLEQEIYQRVRTYTMTGIERIIALIRATQYSSNLEGDIVECGVWKGGSMMAVALTLMNLGHGDRILRLYDTFEGMPPPTPKDRRPDGRVASELMAKARPTEEIWARAGLELVQHNLSSTGYPQQNLKYIQGKVEDTIPADIPEKICLLRLDTDWYESTKHELIHLYPRLVPGGILIIDDYGHWEGSREAVDEYFGSSVFLNRIDYCGRLVVKPHCLNVA